MSGHIVKHQLQNGREAGADKTVEPTISERGRNSAYQAAAAIGEIVENGDKMTFYRAYSHQVAQLAQDFGITEMGARRVMRDEFKATEGDELLGWGKELDNKFYKPQIEAEKSKRSKERSNDQSDKNQASRAQQSAESAASQRDMSFDRER